MSDSAGKPKSYSYFDVIFQEGDQADEMYVITSGEVKITKKMLGIMVTLGELRAGDFFGEMALLDAAPRSATAVAVGPVEAVAYDREGLKEKIKVDPDFAMSVMRAMSRRLRNVDQELTKLLAKGRLPSEEAQQIERHVAA